MSRIVLVTGGMRSGKSTFGENLLKGIDNVTYIATAEITDKEMEERIRRHRESRNQHWKTAETCHDIDEVIRESGTTHFFLDCVTNMITGLIFRFLGEGDIDTLSEEEKDSLYHDIRREFEILIEEVRMSDAEIIMITNEVGMGLVSEYRLGRIFTDFTGFINQYLAGESDEVYFMVSGIPMRLK